MKIQEYVELNTFSTFMVGAQARYFTSVSSVEDIQKLLKNEIWTEVPHYILGEGSNTLFAKDYDGLVIKNEIIGLEVISEDDESMIVRVGAGENWHNFVLWAVDQDLWGIENLVLIPGTVGASPVQNIGAYGVEVSEVITEVEVVNIETGELVVLKNEDCGFEYRNSLFKQKPERYFITQVSFKLKKNGAVVLTYHQVQEELDKLGSKDITPKDVATAIVTIRDSKLPRIGELGTAGSFFKNPIVSAEKASSLLKEFPEMKQFPLEQGEVKLSAAWLIEHIGYKGYKSADVGTYHKHALVLVNHGGARGSEVWDFAQEIILKVKEVFGVDLEPEVQVIL